MVRIRLRRVGGRKQPSYRIVVADQRSPRDGRFIESIGHFNPRTEPETVNYDEERALYWLSVGAQPTEAVQRLFNNLGTYGRLERLRKGEAVEALVEEALAEAEARTPVDPRTRIVRGVASPKKKGKKQAEGAAESEEAPAEAAADAEASATEEAPAADAEADAEAEAPEAIEDAEADAETEAADDAEAEPGTDAEAGDEDEDDAGDAD